MSAEAAKAGWIGERVARPLFLVTVLTGSFLLFLTQPMIARMALPRLGGAPAVWNSAMVVYQALLLGGYAYAHFASRLAPRRQAGLHLVLFGVAALWLPIGLTGAVLPPDASPSLWAPWFLLSSIGPLFFIVSAQAPLMQRWYALESSRGDPYPLYAASNLGSFAGLISYPLLVEPLMSLHQQSLLWSGGYAVLVLLVAVCALTMPRAGVEQAPEKPLYSLPWPRILHWIALAAVPSGLMLSTTTHLTTDIVAVPLLWVLPLGLYLLSFVTAFAARRRVADLITLCAPILLLLAGGFAFSGGSSQPLFTATLGLLLLFVVAVALHTQMYRLRPEAGHLTAFYLAMAVGGVIGGIFCAVLAPALFDWAYEHPLLIVAAAALVPQSPLLPWAGRMPRGTAWALVLLAFILSYLADKQPWLWIEQPWPLVMSVLISLIALVFLGQRVRFALCVLALMLSYDGWQKLAETRDGVRTRSYFGVYSVSIQAEPYARVLTHGTTMHGIQNLTAGMEKEPTSYYARRSGVGQAMAGAQALFGTGARIGVVGLGTGTLSCYARPDQEWRFFEIDPAMARIATGEKFSFLSRCAPQAKIVFGDARISLTREAPGSLDILAVDAFSSDAVPMHLLTREAMAVYRRVLSPDGLLLVHISNRYLDLQPVLAVAAHEGGWAASVHEYVPTEDEEAASASMSVWVALSRDPQTIVRLKRLSGDDSVLWGELAGRRNFPGWSDDYASILPLIEEWRAWLPPVLRGQ
ncbi:MAG TPA: fused MFS/spermidine synthase [Allosphingosinicella sp.]